MLVALSHRMLPRIVFAFSLLAVPALAFADEAAPEPAPAAEAPAALPVTPPADMAPSMDSIRSSTSIEADATDIARIVDTLQTADGVQSVVTASR